VLNGKIGDYIRDDRPALHAFFAVLNRAFADFRLNLKPSLLANYNFMDTGKTSISVEYQNGTGPQYAGEASRDVER
jgi:hypothetical protein